MSENRVFLALGTNLGSRAANLRAAIKALPPLVRVQRVSPVYETQPWGYTEQAPFFNQVVEATTSLEPHALLAELKAIEARLGRTQTFRNGPRVIDLDILLYEDQIVQSENLTIPHPGLPSRSFVLAPLADLAPELVPPGQPVTVRALLSQSDQNGMRRVMEKLPVFGLRTLVMGILNATPDSFSGDGLLQSAGVVEAALRQAGDFLDAGVDILDIGGESTRPNAQFVGEQEEMERVLPVIEALAQKKQTAAQPFWISVDTYKARVAEAALQAGADWINDVWGLRADPRMGQVAAQAHAPVILMHNRLKPGSAELQDRLGGRYVGVAYDNLLLDVQRELLESVDLAREAGIPEEDILLDPGIGFGKTVEQNLELLDRVDEICALGYPVLLGPSRKSFIGYTLNAPPDQRLEGTAAAAAVGIVRGVDILRVHDAAFMTRLARMTDALVRPRWRERAVRSQEQSV